MSGGSYDYEYNTIRDTYCGQMYDTELNEMMYDLCELLHDLEWWQSGDYGEEDYREIVTKFKKKWFKRNDLDVQKIIDESFDKTKNELLNTLGYLKKEEPKVEVKIVHPNMYKKGES